MRILSLTTPSLAARAVMSPNLRTTTSLCESARDLFLQHARSLSVVWNQQELRFPVHLKRKLRPARSRGPRRLAMELPMCQGQLRLHLSSSALVSSPNRFTDRRPR